MDVKSRRWEELSQKKVDGGEVPRFGSLEGSEGAGERGRAGRARAAVGRVAGARKGGRGSARAGATSLTEGSSTEATTIRAQGTRQAPPKNHRDETRYCRPTTHGPSQSRSRQSPTPALRKVRLAAMSTPRERGRRRLDHLHTPEHAPHNVPCRPGASEEAWRGSKTRELIIHRPSPVCRGHASLAHHRWWHVAALKEKTWLGETSRLPASTTLVSLPAPLRAPRPPS
ncbi:hypothetical protein K461DRAFT_16546 [Myriangium duriaei CBS 260.36]|uniref:Uncharacterized protein n=1 Tax=Myriangium duriaei CBS 260.36 TaxID=1168546 RepID=A0A9P4JB34_9PEZI|nr:hypothetical protein K461DRAFT_16546 [Myriangium duriaei CBS 260.36]